MNRIFIESSQVKDVFADVPDADILRMQLDIMAGQGDIVAGTGGLKKIRCGAAGRGKRGGLRVLFADYPATGRTRLVAALDKTVKANWTAKERQQMKRLKRQIDTEET